MLLLIYWAEKEIKTVFIIEFAWASL